jgi:glycosyltransferase involved in cell wall biosynthesis
MRVLHVPYCFYPDPVGGTEVYVYELAKELTAHGIESVVAAPGDRPARYSHDGLEVHRYAVPMHVADVGSLYGEGWPEAAVAFAGILDRVQPAAVHFHSFTAGASVLALRECQAKRIPTVFTYHTPTATCLRGTLLRWGREVCDGRLDQSRCTRCVLHSRGVPRALAALLGRVPPAVSRQWRLRPTGRLWTALGLPHLVDLRLRAIRAFLDGVEGIVVPCDWAMDVLRRNAVPADKLFPCRQGIRPGGEVPRLARVDKSAPLRLVFVGRADWTKGFAIAIDALRASPDLNARLTGFVAAPAHDEAPLDTLRAAAANDPRIRLHPPIWDRSALLTELAQYDYLVAPSLWLETGPMVVLEARAVGVPTIGSRLGGLAELIRDGVDGLLLPPGDVRAWQRCLERVVGDRALLETLRRGIAPPRTMAVVAREMASLYRRVASRSPKSGDRPDWTLR